MRILPVLAVLMILIVLVPTGQSSAASSEGCVLVDYGNGRTCWYQATEGGTVADTLNLTLHREGIQLSMSGDSVESLDGVGAFTVGTQVCRWLFYIWDDGWCKGVANGSREYDGNTFAVGFYADGNAVPAVIPNLPYAMTQSRYDSSFSGRSASSGPSVKIPVTEWSSSFTTGYVDSSILYAGGNLYFTTGGKYGATGSEKDPAVYCLDAVGGETIWKRSYPMGAGYEISSPLIAGGTLVVAATNGHIYGFDAETGEALAELYPAGGSPHMAPSDRCTEYGLAEVEDGDGNWMLEGHSFYTGATTPVYDSGALFFNTFDGTMHAYSLAPSGFSELWRYVPSDELRGCFYYHSPAVAEADGRKVILAGSYSGRMYCVDAGTGEEIWVKRLIDVKSDTNKNPGSVGAIVPCPGGRAIAVCTDGDMASKAGYTKMINVSDGNEIWSLDVICNPPTVVGSLFCVYLSPSSTGNHMLKDAGDVDIEADPGYYGISLDAGRVEWKHASGASAKAGFAYSDGVLYSVDYSPGTFWPSGGGISAIDPDTGNFIWRIRPEPYDGLGFSMTQPTVVNGKVYIGNDSGRVYCVSDGREVLLVDYGDRVEWYPIYGGSTVFNTAILTLKKADADMDYDWNTLSRLGDTTVPGGWRIFVWADNEWKEVNTRDIYSGGHLAIAAYGDGSPSKDPTKDYGKTEDAYEMTSGFMHWSWFALAGTTTAFMVAATALYRR